MKTISQSLLVGLIFCLVSKTYAAQIDVEGLKTQLQKFVSASDSAGQLSSALKALEFEHYDYEQKNYLAFTNARNNEIMPQLRELIKKINNAVPVTKQMVIGWHRDYRKIIKKYEKLRTAYFGKKFMLKNKEFAEKSNGLKTAMNDVYELLEETKNRIPELFKSAVGVEEVESQEEKKEASEEELPVGKLF